MRRRPQTTRPGAPVGRTGSPEPARSGEVWRGSPQPLRQSTPPLSSDLPGARHTAPRAITPPPRPQIVPRTRKGSPDTDPDRESSRRSRRHVRRSARTLQRTRHRPCARSSQHQLEGKGPRYRLEPRRLACIAAAAAAIHATLRAHDSRTARTNSRTHCSRS